jgi:MinD-like ATPase involved in chromosome partitioning or flagellar assembly
MPGLYGQIITFYSYKGGTGRSMVMANVGHLLATGKDYGSPKVLLIDWDLEAPGLERFFGADAPVGPGLIDYLTEMKEIYSAEAPRGRLPESMARDARASAIFEAAADKFPLKKYYTAVKRRPNLFLMSAGYRSLDAPARQDSYLEKVREFDWSQFYHNYGSFFTHLREALMTSFDYVLIDSRTGLTDIGGICTRVMPEKLVLVFAPNHQNIDGVISVATKAINYRLASRDPRSLMVFPVASRIDASASALRITWREGGKIRGEEIVGYQARFEELLRDAYRLDRCDLGGYLDATQIPHDSDYAYGEAIAADIDGTRDRFGIGYACEELTRRLVRLTAPWEAVDEQPGEGSVFISYRRADSAAAGRLYDDLVTQLGHDRVFMDVGSVGVGEEWSTAIEAQLGAAAVMIVLIGKDWTTRGWGSVPGSPGESADPPDFVRGEIATALRHELRVIPTLLDDAEMPAPDQLPADLRPLARRQVISLRSSSWHRDVNRLASALMSVTGPP